jgi:chromosome segregation protein
VERTRLEEQAQRRDADRRGQEIERLRQRVERLRIDLQRAEREVAITAETLAAARVELERAREAPETEGDAGIAAAQEEVRAREKERREAEAAVAELRVRLAGQEQRLQGASAGVRRAAEGGAYLDRQRAERLREQRSLVAEREQRALTFETLAQTTAEAHSAITTAREEAAALGAKRVELQGALNAGRARSRDLSARLRELMERAHRADLELSAVDTERKHLAEQWVDAVAASEGPADDEVPPRTPALDDLLASWDPRAAEQALASSSDPEGELARLRRQIRALGAINPEAPEQYAAAQERYQFLTVQRADLESAREQLEGAILEIDAASRETFLKAFREIAAAFDEMFRKLFGGGATDLRLTDPDDVLETGIDIIVQPPGKKQQNLLLLSGGERALTAAAMLFALLKIRPSPFCVLDEVDAPLDESNVGRFSDTLREFAERTQFVVVTHNRGTMEAADTLYGVTMEERGVSKILSCALTDPIVDRVGAEQRAENEKSPEHSSASVPGRQNGAA